MTDRNETIRLAIEAGLMPSNVVYETEVIDGFERFITIVENTVAEACAKSVIADGEVLKLSNATPKNLAIAIATNLRFGQWREYK